MDYIDIHSHMTSRTTDDYERMALTGAKIICEPSFWAGYDRVSADVFLDYFEHLTTFEPARAARYGIAHYTLLGLNPKESDNRDMARAVLPLIPRFLERRNVVGIGEIGLNRVTRNEIETLEELVDLAAQYDQIIQIHTPHLEDKLKGTKETIRVLKANKRIKPERVLIDHIEEHTAEMVLSAGYWAGISLYPKTKVSPARAADIIEVYGHERVCVASACDWGESNPIAMPHFIMEMRRRGYDDAFIKRIVYNNPIGFFGQSPKFIMKR